MTLYFLLKTLHILSSMVLMGTGIGIAFFMYRSQFSSCVHEKYYASRNTVLADFVFTTPAVIIQPLTGFGLIWTVGYPWDQPWLLVSYGLYLLIGCFWLPVVYFQIRMNSILKHCVTHKTPIPSEYYRLFRKWFWFGFPAFGSLLVIIYLMVAKPSW